MKKLFIILLILLCGCSIKIKESAITNDVFYKAYTSNFSTKEDVLLEMGKVAKRVFDKPDPNLHITTEYITTIEDGKKITFFWKDLDPNSRSLTGEKDRTSVVLRIRVANIVVYQLWILKRDNKDYKKAESYFGFNFQKKEDAETMQALCFRMAELQ